jgi:hypothetical protein
MKEEKEDNLTEVSSKNQRGNKEVIAMRQEKFLKLYAQNGNIAASLKILGIASRNTFYNWLKDPKFAELYKEANETYDDALEAEMDRRGKEGVDKPIFYKGIRVDSVKEYSDVLLIVRAKARMPEKYADRKQVSGPSGAPITFKVVYEDKKQNNSNE